MEFYSKGKFLCPTGIFFSLALNPGGWDRMPDFEGDSSCTVFIRME